MPTHNTYRYRIALVVEGIGSSTSSSKGIAWGYGTGNAPTGTDYEWITGSLVRLPESIDTTVNPMSGDISISAFDFELSNNDTIASQFLYQQVDAPYQLQNNETKDATAIQVEDSAGNGITSLAGAVIWVGDEAILMGTHAGSGSYTGCTRGFWSTDKTAHTAGDRVFTANPYHRFRKVELVVFDLDQAAGASNPRTLWRGFVDNLQTSADGTILQISCEEAIGAIQRGTVNRKSPNLAKTGTASLVLGSTGTIVRANVNATGTHRVQKLNELGSNESAWFQLGDAVALGIYNNPEFRCGAPTQFNSALVSDYEDGEFEEQDKVYQLLVVDRIGDENTGGVRSSTRELTNPYHPIEIAMALLTSTYSLTANVGAQAFDALHGDWGLGIPLAFFDLDSIEAAITADPDLEIDRLILGWDGEPVEVWRVVNDVLLRPYGYYWGVTVDGKLNLNKFKLVSIDSFAAADNIDALPTQLQWLAARSNGVTQVVAEFGGTPFNDPDVITITGATGQRVDSLRRGVFGEERVYSVDFSTKTRQGSERSRKQVLNKFKLGFFAMPRLVINAGDYLINSDDYDMGATLTVNLDVREGWLVDNSGSRTTTTTGEQFAGTIVGRRLNLASMTYSLTLLMTNFRSGQVVRWIAPAAEQDGAVTDNMDGTWDVVIQDYEWDSTSTIKDISYFTVGDEIEWWDPDGTRHTVANEPAQITAIDAGTNTITVDDTNLLAGTYPSGSILRLARYDFYANSSVISGAGDNVYVYLADSNQQLGSSNDDGVIYG